MGFLSHQLRYADKRFAITKMAGEVRDSRRRPKHRAPVVVRGLLVMIVARLGSINKLACAGANSLRAWIGGLLPSADTLGRASACLHADDIRAMVHKVYSVTRRGKNLQPLRGLRVLLLDAHDFPTSELRHCPGCLKRTVTTRRGQRVQYYHRFVAAMLVHRSGCLVLDIELQRPGEDEIACAKRLLERLLQKCPKAFDVVGGDALYMNPGLWRLAASHRKHMVAVVKNENRDLVKDAEALFGERNPVTFTTGSTTCLWWDLDGFTTWPQFGPSVRVVKSIETKRVRRQHTRLIEEITTTWMWATTLPPAKAGTQTIFDVGHGRWCIENHGFNEMVHAWHLDHCYRHEENAILVMLLLLCLAYNIFHIMITFNLKPPLRDWPPSCIAEIITAEFWMVLKPAAPS